MSAVNLFGRQKMHLFGRQQQYTINPPDDTHSVIYLGNVLTVLGKGDQAVDRPLALIWKTYCQRSRSDMHMHLAVTRSGLKAETRQQGLTEYWTHRITYCSAPTNYPRLFCWVYKHEGRRLKSELRCHAVLCRKSTDPIKIARQLTDFLKEALDEYRKNKLQMQNTRLYGTVPCPRRKQLLRTGLLNFRPSIDRSKSVSRLGSIDEGDEEQEYVEKMQMSGQDEDYNDTLVQSNSESGSNDGDCSPFIRCQLQIGREKPQLENHQSVLQHLDSVSDESGYQDEKSSLEIDDSDEEEEPKFQITAL